MREQRIPFEISTLSPNKATLEAMEEGNKIAHDSSVKGYSDLNEMWKDLEK